MYYRSMLIHFAPLLFHALDMAFNQSHLIASYQLKPKTFMCLWCLTSFALVGFAYEMFVVVNNTVNGIFEVDEEDVNASDDITKKQQQQAINIISSRHSRNSMRVDENSISHARFLFNSKMFSLLGSVFALYILYFMVLKYAYFRPQSLKKLKYR
jgi:hypothetical protein